MTMLEQTVGRLARTIPGATGVFREYKLDFCCGGNVALGDALAEKGIDPQPVVAALETLANEPNAEQDWNSATDAQLIDHLLSRFHARHREQLPELIQLASRVEHVHGERPECPVGLAALLHAMRQELESHMMKEEQILFPMIKQGAGAQATGPVTVMRMEHDQHLEALQRLAALTNDITPPQGACNTWRALYRGLNQLREDLMTHMHLESNILFARAAGEIAPA